MLADFISFKIGVNPASKSFGKIGAPFLGKLRIIDTGTIYNYLLNSKILKRTDLIELVKLNEVENTKLFYGTNIGLILDIQSFTNR